MAVLLQALDIPELQQPLAHWLRLPLLPGEAEALHRQIADRARQQVGQAEWADRSNGAVLWVRQIFEQAGFTLGTSRKPLDQAPATSPQSPNSLIGPDIGAIVREPDQLQPGDIVSFTEPGGFAPNVISLVGIYVGDGQVVYRQGSNGEIVRRALTGLEGWRFFAAVRPHLTRSLAHRERPNPLMNSDPIGAQVYEKVNPAVVTIYNQGEAGAGILLTPEGLILTANHVVRGPEPHQVEVRTADGKPYWGKVMAFDRLRDLALVQIRGTAPFPTVTLSPTPQLEMGQSVYAIGSPGGKPGVMSRGTLIGTTAQGDLKTNPGLLRPGNSGGPLLNTRGEVIGINKGLLEDDSGLATDVGSARQLLRSAGVSGQ